jgi:hypothetical protein
MARAALPRPIVILDDGNEFLHLATIADVRTLLGHLPKETRAKDHVAARRGKAKTSRRRQRHDRAFGGVAKGADVGKCRVNVEYRLK